MNADSNTKPKKEDKKQISPEEMEKFSKELSTKLSQMNKKNTKKTRVLSFRFNPFILVIGAVLGIFLFIAFFNRGSFIDKISIDEMLTGLQENRFSQILIQDDGKIVANGKTYLILSAEIDESQVNKNTVDYYNETEFKELTLESLVSSIDEENLRDKIRSFVNSNSEGYSKIILGQDFIIAVKNNNDAYLISDSGKEEFETLVEDKGIVLDEAAIEIKSLGLFSKNIEQDSFSERLKSEQFETIYQIDDLAIGVLKEEHIDKFYIDWAPSYTFKDILAQEDVPLVSENYEVISVSVPSGISLDDILTILTLVAFVVLAVIIFRSAQASGMGIMQFGQSKAKMFFGSKTETTFKDVAGIDEAREELNEIVDFLRSPNKYRKLGARIPKGILMFGPPGTGKTLLARAIAGEAGVPFFHTSGSEFEEMLVGAGASRVRDLFAKAKKAAPALIFIDEIDAVARKRGTRIQSGSTEQTLNQILVEMDGFEKNTNVIVIAATNRPDVLDPAILRPGRFDRQVRIDVPDKDGRREILEIYAKNKPIAKDLDMDKLAKRTVGFTGADLENVLNEAAIITAKENRKEVTMADVEEAISKVVMGPAKRSRKRTDKELKLVAYHEAGHAVVAKYTKDATPVDKISIVSRGNSGGVTMFLPEKDEYITSKGKLIADIAVSLGGRAAEEIVLDDISTGASNDIEKATRVARAMVQRFGMSKALGLVQYGQDTESEYLGYSYGENKDFSEKTSEMIDNEVRVLIQQGYQDALNILKGKREVLDKLANLLLEKEVVDKEEFDKLFD